MKIDAFDLGLSASRIYKKTITREVSREFSFTEIMRGVQVPSFTDTGTMFREYFMPVSVNGQDALSARDEFLEELEKLREIIQALEDYLAKMTTGSCPCITFRVSDIYLMPVHTATYWEYTETQSVRYDEFELTRVQAGGKVRTADDREIDINFDFAMDRSYIREEAMTRTAEGYAFIDPLLINTGMTLPEFAGARFEFDLDMDGEMEDLPLPEPGVGFLSLDLNGDGIINDGSELFGPATGDGFGELAAYDSDENFWIDENDPIFDQLTLWERAASGDDPEGMVLTRLKDAGIGAIYLGGVASPFDLTGGDNELQGRITDTSIALTEAGEVLPVQEMEYKV